MTTIKYGDSDFTIHHGQTEIQTTTTIRPLEMTQKRIDDDLALAKVITIPIPDTEEAVYKLDLIRKVLASPDQDGVLAKIREIVK